MGIIRKIAVLAAVAICSCASVYAQKGKVRDTLELSDMYLDTVVVHKAKELNNYCTIGVGYGVCLNNFSFNPTKTGTKFAVNPNYFNVMFTHYEKMFDYMPFFSFTGGFAHSYEGVAFKTDDEGNARSLVDGADGLTIECYEIPIIAQMHFDAEPIMFLAGVGVYGGYRAKIQRTGPTVSDEYLKAFHDYENRFDYGMQAGAGFAFLLNPFEIHFNAMFRWGWQSLYQPDYYSQYYYRYAYPTDVLISVSLHYQLTRRRGRTTSQLRAAARERVYGETKDN